MGQRMIGNVKKLGKYVGYPQIGKFYFYWYSPKLKDSLPVYDRFPYVLPIEPYSDGWLGLNLHYLPIQSRKILMNQLLTISNNKDFDETTKIRASYSVLKYSTRIKHFEPCIKRYLTEHIRSRLVEIDSENWKIALVLPVQRFVPGAPY